MKKNYSVHFYVLTIFAAMLISFGFSNQASGQVTITKWDFEADNLIPVIGEGTAENVGGTSTAYATGLGGGRAWNTSVYPAQGTNEATAGVQFNVSTDGFQNVTVYWDMRHSNTSANRIRLQYTVNGNTWLNFEANTTNAVNTLGGNDVGFDNGRYIATAGDSWYVRSADLSGISGATSNPLFAIRIVSEFVDGANYGAANPTSTYSPNGTWRFDNVTISGVEITGGNAVKLAVTSVNGGASPTVNAPFNITVQAQDADGLPANVSTDTQVTLTKETGTGVFGGTLVGTIASGTNAVTFTGLTYSVAESGVSIKATATSGMTLTPGISAPFTVLAAATQLKFVNFPANGIVNQSVAAFTVEACRPDNTVDVTYTGTITLSKQSGPGNIAGTTAVAAVQGIATFSDISFSATGSYTLAANATGLTGDISTAITIIDAPQITTVILPQYISGADPVDSRLPFAFRATLTNLFPNATYKFINQAIITGDSPTTNGAGNLIFIMPDGTFNRTTAPSFATPGFYGEFTTDQNGSFTGWFMLETTNNARFTPGNHIFMRIRINDGAGGNNVSHFLTTADSVKVIGFSANADPNYGTGIRAVSFATPKNFAFLYDNTTGTGRPLFGTSIETVGIDYTAIQYAPFYKENVSGQNGAWGGIVPNVNPNGVKLIQERSLADGSIAGTHVSNTGVWGDANTVNPTGGLENVLVINLIDVPVIFASPSVLSGFTYEFGQGPSASQTYSVTGQNLLGQGFITVTAPSSFEISLNGTSFTNTFQIEYNNGQIVNQPVTVHVRLKAGLNVGVYNLEQIIHTSSITSQVNVTCSGSVTAPYVPPVITSAILPQYTQGLNGTNETRVPYAYWVTISDLQPNTTYRYINQVVNYADAPTTNGAGNIIFVKQSGSFVRTSSPSFETAGNYGEFTANASGSYSGWFMTEPTGNARFTPGAYVKMRIRINDGQGGTVAAHFLTTADSVKVINFGTANDPAMGTGIRGWNMFVDDKDFMLLYDNVEGAGRPIYATSIEITGIDYLAIPQYASFYKTDVSGLSGRWGGIVPNVLPNGIRRIESRRLTTGVIDDVIVSDNGVWWENVNTVNPTGGLDDIIVIDFLESVGQLGPANAVKVFSAMNQIIIQAEREDKMELSISNTLGQIVMQQNLSGSTSHQIDNRLKAGIYIVSLRQGNAVFNSKILVQ